MSLPRPIPLPIKTIRKSARHMPDTCLSVEQRKRVTQCLKQIVNEYAAVKTVDTTQQIINRFASRDKYLALLDKLVMAGREYPGTEKQFCISFDCNNAVTEPNEAGYCVECLDVPADDDY